MLFMFIDPRFTKISAQVVLLSMATSEILVVVLAYFVSSYKVVAIACIAVPSLVACLLFRFLVESPV